MPIRSPIRLHRHPAVDAVLFVAALAVALLLLRSAVARPPLLAVGPDSARFDGGAAYREARVLADSFSYRVTGHPNGAAAAAWLAARFEALGLRVERQPFELWLRGRKVRGENVVARSDGRGPGTVLLMAHYDGATTSSQSAAASASGTATLLELARVLEARPHRHPFVYAALDAGTWGHAGAAHLASTPVGGADSVLAAVSIDHVANGPAAGVVIAGAGQGGRYAPLWLRTAAADAFARGDTPVRDIGFLGEWYQRTLRLADRDQGPLVARDVPAINVGTTSADPAYARFLYHTPGDRIETLEPGAFRVLGAGIERLARAIDQGPRMTGAFTYLRLGRDRMIRGAAIALAAVLLFVPLLLATWEGLRTALVEPAARAALGSELARAGGWWVTGLGGWLALQAMVVLGIVPRYSIAPATERDPFLYAVDRPAMLALLGVLLAIGFGLGRVRVRLRLVAADPFAGRALALATLALLTAVSVLRNPFAAVWLLALPAWLWPWIGPSRRSVTGAVGALLAVVSVGPALLLAFLIGRHFELGVRTAWYLFLQAAYGTWSPLTSVMTVVFALAAWRLVGTATTRLIPDGGD